MTVKIVVRYPQPTDPEQFEGCYHGEHMPLCANWRRQRTARRHSR